MNITASDRALSCQSASTPNNNPDVRLHPEALRPSLHFTDRPHGCRLVEIPHNADTTYTAHGYFRYIGKYPPQLVAYVLNRYPVDGPILDPMCGGGTTLTEARLRGLDAIGCDINPVSRLVATIASTPYDPEHFASTNRLFVAMLDDHFDDNAPLFEKTTRNPGAEFHLKHCREYFTQNTVRDLGAFFDLIDKPTIANYRDAYLMCLLAVARRISRANIKKMNLEIDDSKRNIETLRSAVTRQIQKMEDLNRDFYAWAQPCKMNILDVDCRKTGLEDESVGAVFLHPPYLTNTAFSEFTQLQLAMLGISHKDIWKRELRCRGSFVHEPDGLRKYVVGWGQTIAEACRVLRPGGLLVTVVGDGQIDYVRIPIGVMTNEIAMDSGFEVLEKLFHVLNNNTGRTQSRKMKGQHVAVFRKV